MEQTKLIIDGIFDKNSFDHFSQQGIHSFIFDLRPKSFNFIQQYVMIEILKKEIFGKIHFSLRFENDKDFVIKQFVQEVLKFFPRERLSLSFSDALTSSFYDQFKLPYSWHFQDFATLEKVAQGEFLTHLILSIHELVKISQRGSFETFLQKVNKLAMRRDIQIRLLTPWENSFDDIAIFNLLNQFSYLERVLEVNSEVTSQYRMLNMQKTTYLLHQMNQKSQIK